MKIGIVVYSQTGNTLSVAEKIRERLAAKGHSAVVEQITVNGGVPNDINDIRFGKLPDLAKYEAVVLAAPVQGFSLCAAMAAYLPQLPSLSGKKVACFVTKNLPGNWTGGSKAIKMITGAVEDRNGKVSASGIVHWGKRDMEIGEVVEKLAAAF